MRALLIFAVNVFWILVLAATAKTALAESQGYLFTGSKQLLAGTNETFCVSVKDAAHSVANCSLDLIVDNVTIASVNHQLNGIFILKSQTYWR